METVLGKPPLELDMVCLGHGVDLVRLLESAFVLSDGPKDAVACLGPGEAQAIINGSAKVGIALQAEKVKGRMVNLLVFQGSAGGFWMRRAWAGHSQEDLKTLFNMMGIDHGQG
jgi:hypothetical protein